MFSTTLTESQHKTYICMEFIRSYYAGCRYSYKNIILQTLTGMGSGNPLSRKLKLDAKLHPLTSPWQLNRNSSCSTERDTMKGNA
ncbi:hypothetical protein XELAEV_18014572mg [Xenopus laevis]|uniref:Uncharacterized protein n=1 Tax=Xenopus laevis TaxID=8355 RepID=A0A974HVJ5_XENLA|nr:hypothetical protein XELAEV_18014572mg [Xenopus laevis]